jgi:hypothetical protein
VAWKTTNAAGARLDGLISDPNADSASLDWDGIWEGRAQKTSDGWTAELALPAKTLHFTPNASAWGFNVERVIPRQRVHLRWTGTSLDAVDLAVLETDGEAIEDAGDFRIAGDIVDPAPVAHRVANDKAATSEVLQASDIPCIPHTLFLNPALYEYVPPQRSWERMLRLIKDHPAGLVVKPNDGTSGKSVTGISPSYEQKHFRPEEKRGRLRLIASADGDEITFPGPPEGRSPGTRGERTRAPSSRLARGDDWTQVGPELKQLVRLDLKPAKLDDKGLRGEVIALDGPYGNLVTNIAAEDFLKLGYQRGEKLK